MVRLDDLDVVALIQDARGGIQQLENEVDPDGHVRREDNRDVAGRCGNFFLAFCFEAGGADHHPHPRLAAQFEMCKRALRPGEIDQTVDRGEAAGEIVADPDFARQTGQLPGRLADGGAPRNVERAGQRHSFILQGRLEQHATHAPTGPQNTDSCSAHDQNPTDFIKPSMNPGPSGGGIGGADPSLGRVP